MTGCLQNVIKGRGGDRRNRRGVALPGVAPGRGAFLEVGVHDDDELAVLLGRHGGVHGKGGLAAAEESQGLHD
jgi:hypothetical protein